MPSDNARDWLKGKTLEELDAIEFGGRMLFPDKILKPKKGGFIEVPVMVRVLREPEIAKARTDAVTMFKKRGLDRKEDADLFEELDLLCKLAYAIRTVAEPHGQYMPVEQLIGRTDPKTGESDGFDISSLHDLWERLQVYRKMLDPRISEPTIEDVFAAADGMETTRNISPLVAIAGPEVEPFVISMGCQLASLRRLLRSLQSTAISTQEPSPAPS